MFQYFNPQLQHRNTSTLLIYKSKFRTGTLIVRLFISFLALVLLLTGVMAVVGMIISKTSETGSMVFVFMTVTVGILIFKASGWNIRSFLIYDDKFEIHILGGIKKIKYPASSMIAFNDLKMMIMDQSSGIGIVTTDHQLIKIMELDIIDFPVFVEHLQKLVRWDLNLKYDAGKG